MASAARRKLVLSLLSLTSFVVASDATTFRPVVGVLTLPSVEGLPANASYLPASYVKWLEAAGMRVAPLLFDLPLPQLRQKALSLNGILFTGGSSPLFNNNGSPSLYLLAGEALYKTALAVQANEGRLPIWGTCLGFEMLSVLISGAGQSILSSYQAENISLSLNFTKKARGSRLFGGMNDEVAAAFAQNITVNEHTSGLSPSKVMASTTMREAVDILSTNLDLVGKPFVSSFEHRSLPIFATQFHPERPAYEWITQRYIPHSANAVLGMQYLANRFAKEVRSSSQHFKTPHDERASLIYNSQPFYSDVITAYYEQMYAFPLSARLEKLPLFA